MNFLLQRFSDNGQSTLDLWFNKDTKRFYMFGLEDQHREIKVKGDTRISAGLYDLEIHEVATPLTLKHRTVYGPWFEFHIEVMRVPNFTSVYVHAGNDELHTEGCLLGGDSVLNNMIQAKNQLLSSMAAIKRFYQDVYPRLKAGEKCTLEIRDEDYLFK
jgi:hypothetical protein